MFDIKKIAQKINEFSQKSNDNIEDKKIKKKKFPIFEFIFKPFNLFFDNSKKLLIISLVYGAILSLLSLAFGHSYACSFEFEESAIFYCANVGIIYVLYLFIKMFIISNLIIYAYNILNKDEKNMLGQVLSFMKNIKSFGLLMFFISMLFFPVLSLFVLYEREPNPNFIIETIFFAFVSIGFLTPFIAIRFFGIFSCVLLGENFSIKYTWEATKGKMLHILVSLFFIMITAIIMYRGFYVAILESGKINSIHIVLFSEYIYSTMLSIVFIFITGHIYAQKTMIIDEEKLD